MKFTKEHAGKWVATKGEKVIATDTGFQRLFKRMHARKDRDSIAYDLIPKGIITGPV
ncbi:hypothetical protein HY213_02455 [Candidatus Peregrinibacteria bacterium]|nr:hypothetical protein [Candidatus Peregrinibacteria bacterium]